MSGLWIPLLIGVLLTLVLFYFGIIYAKRGDRTFSFIFFPYTSILDFIFPGKASRFGIALGSSLFFLQYPLYAIILGLGHRRSQVASWLLLIAGPHILLSVACFAFDRQRRLRRKS